MNIRHATIEDLPEVQQLGFELLEYEKERWDSALDSQWPFSEAGKAMYEEAIRTRVVLLAEADDNIAGFLIGSISPANPDAARNIATANMNNIYVRENWRGQKIGAALADEFRQICKEADVTRISVTVNSANEAAIEFYKKAGFEPSRLIMAQEI